MTRRTIVIGDVHGCFYETLDLLAKCQVTSSDRVIFLGDLVDRGPFPYETVELAMEHESVMGNHEERILKYHDKWLKKGTPTNPDIIASNLRFSSPEHKRSFMSLSPEMFDWFRSLPKFLRLPEHNALLVHAGVLPEIPPEHQSDHILLHACNIREPKRGLDRDQGVKHGYWEADCDTWWTSKAPPDSRFWAAFYDGSHGRVVFGHSAFAEGVGIFPHAVGIDTACVFGGTLTACVMTEGDPEWQFVSVPCRKAYYNQNKVGRYEVWPGCVVFS